MQKSVLRVIIISVLYTFLFSLINLASIGLSDSLYLKLFIFIPTLTLFYALLISTMLDKKSKILLSILVWLPSLLFFISIMTDKVMGWGGMNCLSEFNAACISRLIFSNLFGLLIYIPNFILYSYVLSELLQDKKTMNEAFPD